MKEKFIKFMEGRYGVDGFARFTMGVALVCIVASVFFRNGSTTGAILNTVGLAAIIYTYFRMLSRNIQKRYAENQKYLSWDSYVKYGRQRFLTAPLMKWMFGKYVSDPAQRGNDLMSPVRASAERLRGLPATLIVVAENDILRDEGEAMGRRLDEAGVEVTTVRFNGVVHDWGMLNGFAALHPTRTLIRLVGSVLRDYLEK